MRKNLRGGFTLVELLVVISIIGVLTTMGLSSYIHAQKRGRDTARVEAAQELAQAAEQYFTDNGSYPHYYAEPLPISDLTSPTKYLTKNITAKFKNMPDAGANANGDLFYWSETGESFCVLAELENTTEKNANCIWPAVVGTCRFTDTNPTGFCVESRQ